MSLDQPVTVEQVRASKWQVVAHLNGGDWGALTYQCVDFPRLFFRKVYPKTRRSKVVPDKDFAVEGFDDPFPTLEVAVEALNKLEGADVE